MCGLKEADIRHGLEFIFASREKMSEEERQNAVNAHLEQMRDYYNGYKFGTVEGGGVYNTNLCLDYLQRLLIGDPFHLIDPNNELSESVLMFIGKHVDSTSLLAELLETKQTPYIEIQQNIRLLDLANIDNQSITFLKSFLFYFGALTFADRSGYLRLPNVVVTKTIVERVLQLCAIRISSSAFQKAVRDLTKHDNIDSLCSYLEPRLKDWIKRGNLSDDRELVTKVMFQASLSTIPHYLSETEVHVPKVYSHKQYTSSGYIDLLLVETKPISVGGRPKRFVFEFKCKGVNFLDLGKFYFFFIFENSCMCIFFILYHTHCFIEGGNTWEDMDAKADEIEAMSIEELFQLKCGGIDKTPDQGKTVQQIFEAAVKQLMSYVKGLQTQENEFDTIAFVVLTVGSRRFIYDKIQTHDG